MTAPTPLLPDVALLAPAFVLAGWTIAVLTWLAFVRIRAALKGEVGAEDFALGESGKVPERVALANRNYMNLLELPVLFYVVVVIGWSTGAAAAAPSLAWLAWSYAGLRIVHSLIHLGYNDVVHRLSVFAISNVVLGAMWVNTGLALWQRPAG